MSVLYQLISLQYKMFRFLQVTLQIELDLIKNQKQTSFGNFVRHSSKLGIT